MSRNPRLAVHAIRLLPAIAGRRNLISEAVSATFSSEGAIITGEINIIFLDRRAMLRLNKRYLNHSHDTDVIAFRYDSDLPKGAETPFGDIYISAYKARLQAKELGHPLLQEVLTLAVHGALHLLGYDDATPAQKARMFKKQDAVLAELL
jgi:probable rRNA maturation factor